MSLEKYSIFDSLIEGVQVIDFEGRYVYLNEAVGRQGRISPSVMIGQSMTAVYPGIEKTEIFQHIQACLHAGTSCKMLNQFYYPDGSFGWFELRLQPVIEGVLIFSSDVTAQKQLEVELQKVNQELEKKISQTTNELTSLHAQLNTQLEQRLQQIQTEVSDYKHALDESCIVAITDQKGIIKHVNDNFCMISGFSREELLGQDHSIINSGYHPRSFIRDIWVTIAQGNIWRGEIKNKAKDGSFYWVDTTIVPFLDELGKPYQYLAIRNDITGRKLAEEQLLKTNEQLEIKVRDRTLELTQALEREKELSDMKSRFVSMASHEFRTPLSAILSSTSLVEHYIHPDVLEKRNKHLERIRSSVKNLTNILDDFLSLEKLDQG
ncbi:MAG: PAS domain S-box protein, partial [Flavisolibacter sp.]